MTNIYIYQYIIENKPTDSFRKNILTVGNTLDPNEAYRKFRGKDPDITPLLKKLGFIK